MPKAESFNEKIYCLLKKIPKGKVTTYKILAEAAGTKAYRAVGQAMRCNPYAPVVPCHRVVKSDGSIGGFAGSINPNGKEVRKKIAMLGKEGIATKNRKIVNFKKVLIKKLT
ncbi:MAG: MGMT family protein [Nanoarchaeota archaeon]